MKKNQARREVRKRAIRHVSTTVRGIVIPVEWDEDGNVLGIVVSTPGENDYLIEQDSKGRELLSHMRQEVEIIGVVKGTKGDQTITVITYELKRTNH